MRLIIKEYVSSLGEEAGLNELIPKLYSLDGYTIINKAQKGVRQNGVDILAEKNGEPYLITIKQGSLNRSNWDTDPTALRQSLNDIIDAYIPNNLSIKYYGKKIHIDIVLNGYVEQAVQDSLTGYEKNHRDIEFNQVNLDELANKIYSHLLNENLFSFEEASMLRKCLALISEKDFQLNIYSQLVERQIKQILDNINSPKKIMREINKLIMIQSIICEWDSESNVYLNKIKCCETLLLKIVSDLFIQSKSKKYVKDLYDSILEIYIKMLEKYYFSAKKLEGTYRSLPVYCDLGHKLKLFEILGILAIYGLILMNKRDLNSKRIDELHDLIITLLNNYDATTYIPMEFNCTEITIVLLFLYKYGDTESARNYVISLLNCQSINYIKYKKFPFPYNDYYDALMESIKPKDKFESSLVIECLYDWLIILKGYECEDADVELYKKSFANVSMQLWMCDKEDEIKFYQGSRSIGCCYVMPKLVTIEKHTKILKKVAKNIKYKELISEKKEISYISLIASRLYKMPVNSYLYLKNLK